MLRGLLSHLAQRALLARAALPLLAAYAPEAFRPRSGAQHSLHVSGASAHSLHVFARQPTTDHAKIVVHDDADVGDLKKAVIAELQLDAPP